MAIEQTAFEPFQRILIDRQKALDDVLGLSCYAIEEAMSLPDLVSAMHEVHVSLNTKPEHAEAELKHADRISEIAAKEVDLDFAHLHEMATVVLWGALEAAVRDFVANLISEFPQARSSDQVAKLKIRFAEYEALSKEERAEYLVEQLEREISAPLKQGVGRFETLLAAVNVSVTVGDDVRRTLHEMCAVRNVLVHRAGRADRRFIGQCPWIPVSEGEAVRVTRARYSEYNKAVRAFTVLVIRSGASAVWAWDKQNNGKEE